MELHKAENILEVACGTGKLLQLGLQFKRPECSYLASDLASNMVKLAQKNLENNFNKYESKLSYKEWLNKNNLSFKVLNAEEPIENTKPFDRIICNNVLMITSDARKMMTNLYNHSKPGCLFGVNVWGDKNQNNLMIAMRDSIV